MMDLEDAGRFIVAVGRLRRRLKQLPAVDGIPGPEMTALVRLDRDGPATTSGLAKAEQISPQSMSVAVAALEQRGLVTRAADPADGRRRIVSLTDEGQEAVRHKRAVRAEQVAAALGLLSPRELDALREATPVLERLADVL